MLALIIYLNIMKRGACMARETALLALQKFAALAILEEPYDIGTGGVRAILAGTQRAS
jgi:hypothetical protein